ncbi:MAG: type II toxin-antitoxin system RelE/ParE family toxin [Thermoguttaceae bacterium]|jgi:plasmid stabilization system protein ParE
MLRVEYLLGARRDFDESFDWYAARSPVAALRFARAVDLALTDIAGNPEQFAVVDDVHRQCPLKRFPFRIVYRVANERIVVVALAHASRRPGYWKDRPEAG